MYYEMRHTEWTNPFAYSVDSSNFVNALNTNNGIQMDWVSNSAATTLRVTVPYTSANGVYFQVLLSYNKTGYVHDGGGSDPDIATSANGNGLSLYYRASSSSTFSGSWTQVTSSSSDDFDEDDDTTWPDTMTAFFGARTAGGANGLTGGGYMKDIKMWNATRLTTDL
tara:strand:- start:537 stop:1037 length:501 start_codon:yes stop_codon:yes gene_type:complete